MVRPHHKGLSEYKRNFKWRKSDQKRHCSPTHEQKCQWAGLRSDEFGISREPSFISRRKVPYYNTQIAKVFEWIGDNDSIKETSSECDSNQPTQPLEWHTDQNYIIQKKIKTPDAPRPPEKTHSGPVCSRSESSVALVESKKMPSKTDVHENRKTPSKTEVHESKKTSSKMEVHENRPLVSMKEDLGKVDNVLNRVLQKKSGMNVSRVSGFPRSSEYQREFVWKTSQKLSPLLAADKFIHRASQPIPPFKSIGTIPETEYERNFKVSPPVKELKQRCYSEERGHAGSEPVKDPPGEKNEKKTFSKTTENPSKQGTLEAEKNSKRKHKPPCLHRSFRKINTEYRSKFLSPAQYMYKDGAWIRIKKDVSGQVKELREKAEAYRQRIWGTHFSRDHLNQLLSDNNRLWDLSSDSSAEESISNNIQALDLAGIPEKPVSPASKTKFSQQLHQNNTEKLGLSDASTLPLRRRLVWGEPANAEEIEVQPSALEEREEKENKQELEENDNIEANNKDASTDDHQEENETFPVDMADPSVSSRKGGRLPTSQLRALGGGQITHDFATPAAGGAVLVSPPKGKASSSHTLLNHQISREDLKRKSNKDDGKALSLSPPLAAGLKTFDPLPVRKDQRPSLPSSDAKTPSSTELSDQTVSDPVSKSAKDPASSYWSPSCRIQGTLRDPEFQHNGNSASPKTSWLQLPLQERNYDDEDEDRLSQLSARSAASNSFASQVLERAQRRKENFWGKM